MARYTGSVCRQCRREGTKLFLKGDRCYSDKCAMTLRHTPPGMHGQGRKKQSNYGIQLREKQKVRRAYGILESQFHKYYEMAANMKGVTGDNMLSLIERRLDNVAYRLNFGESRPMARQMVTHGHILVNGKKVDIASYRLKVGDVVEVKEKSRNMALVLEAQQSGERDIPDYLELGDRGFSVRFVRFPELADVPYPVKMEPNLVVEYYSS